MRAILPLRTFRPELSQCPKPRPFTLLDLAKLHSRRSIRRVENCDVLLDLEANREVTIGFEQFDNAKRRPSLLEREPERGGDAALFVRSGVSMQRGQVVLARHACLTGHARHSAQLRLRSGLALVPRPTSITRPSSPWRLAKADVFS